MTIDRTAGLPDELAPEQRAALRRLGICTVADLAAYAPSRHAAFLLALEAQDELTPAARRCYLRDDATVPADGVAGMPAIALRAVTPAAAAVLADAFGLTTLGEIATWPPFLAASRPAGRPEQPGFFERPSAPPELIPEPAGSTQTTVRLSNYVREVASELADHELLYRADPDEPVPPDQLMDAFARANLEVSFGYLALLKQRWTSSGSYLGDILHSLALAPGEQRNIAFVDWFQRQVSRRDERTTTEEMLESEIVQTRAISEVVRTTAQEHLVGSTEIDATTRVSGQGLTGGMASGASHASTATGGLGADLTALVGLPVGGSASAAGGDLASSAQALGGSLVHSKGTVQGVIQSETSGEREVLGDLVQNISDATVQNASNVRSVMSTVVVEDEQRGRQRARTRTVTNYNHSHALTVHYFEVLQRYLVDTRAVRLTPVLYLPFRPLDFTIDVIAEYWPLLRSGVRATAPARFRPWDEAVKSFSPTDASFDATGDLSIERVTVNAVDSVDGPIEVEMTDATPDVKFTVLMADLEPLVDLELEGRVTYLSYPVLLQSSLTTSTFGSSSSVPLDEGVALRIALPQMRSRFRSALKSAIDRAVKRELEVGLDFDEIGAGSNRTRLKEDVDAGQYRLMNGGEGVDLELEVEYVVADQHGNEQLLHQSHTTTLTFAQVEGEVERTLVDVSATIATDLATVADFNPFQVIEDIEEHFRFHKYAYTKYLLASLEKEQLIDVVEHLRVKSGSSSEPLTHFIDPNPLGMVENQLIFRLVQSDDGPGRPADTVYSHTLVVRGPNDDVASFVARGAGTSRESVRAGQTVQLHTLSGNRAAGEAVEVDSGVDLEVEVGLTPGPDGRFPVTGHLTTQEQVGRRVTTVRRDLSGSAESPDAATLQLRVAAPGLADDRDSLQDLEVVIERELEPVVDVGLDRVIDQYVEQITAFEARVQENPRKQIVHLPTAGVFAEAILGRSNASEYVDPRRFYHWQDSPIPHQAPQILPVDLNVDRTGGVAEGLDPTVPDSVVQAASPLLYPMPTSLTSALDAVRDGSMFANLSGQDQLTSVLGNLSQVASQTAQLAGQLSGQAAADALDAAVALGQQVASLTGGALADHVASPPETPTEKAGALNELDAISANPSPGGPVSAIDDAKSDALGTPLGCDDHDGGGTGGGGGGTGGGSGGGTGDGEGEGDGEGGDPEVLDGTLRITSALPEPYAYARADLLEVIEGVVPDDVGQDLRDLYDTVRGLVVDDEAPDAEKAAATAAVLSKAKGAGAGTLVGLLADLVTSEGGVSLIEDLLVLVYDLVHTAVFPHVGFDLGGDLGTWTNVEFDVHKKRGEPPTVTRRTQYPYCRTTYLMGGDVVTNAPNPPTWAAEDLSGAVPVWTEEKPASEFVWVLLDFSDRVLINVESTQSVMVDPLSLISAMRSYARQRMVDQMEARSESATEAVGEALKDLVGESWVVDLAEWVVGGVLDVQTVMATVVFDLLSVILLPPSVVIGEIRVESVLSLAVELEYRTTGTPGWQLAVSGRRSQFPALQVSFAGDHGTVDVDAGSAHPLGFHSLLLLGDEAIQVETQDLPSPARFSG